MPLSSVLICLSPSFPLTFQVTVTRKVLKVWQIQQVSKASQHPSSHPHAKGRGAAGVGHPAPHRPYQKPAKKLAPMVLRFPIDEPNKMCFICSNFLLNVT